MTVFMPTLIEGFFTGAGLIIAIGAQNAFVLKQGLLKNHVFPIALLCALIDAGLIALGVGGVGTLLASSPILLMLAKWGGVAFLTYYGFRSFRSVWTPHALIIEDNQKKPSLQKSLLMAMTFSLLNPHVYLDTVVLLGTISSQFPECEKPSFAYGAIASSFTWFFVLAYGARFLAPLFQKALAWKILDFIIGCIMWGIALSLLFWSHSG